VTNAWKTVQTSPSRALTAVKAAKDAACSNSSVDASDVGEDLCAQSMFRISRQAKSSAP